MPRNASILLGAGWSLILIGLGLALYFFLAYDTTVQAQGLASIVSEMVQGNRVHNQGLMNNRLVGVVLGPQALLEVLVGILGHQSSELQKSRRNSEAPRELGSISRMIQPLGSSG